MNIEEIKRYSRQMILNDFGTREQKRLKESKVAVTGAGGLGNPVATYLTLAGVGKIHIYDMDKVELSNLNRQFHFNAEESGQTKAELLARKLARVNPEIEVKGINKKITYDNAFQLFKGYDAIVDGTDNFAVRYAVNDSAVVNGIPLFHGAALMYEGRAMSIVPGETACFRCVFPEAPPAGTVPTCREAGILGSVTGIIGSIQATEAIRYLAGLEIGLKNRLLILNADIMSFDKVKINSSDSCTACGREFIPSPVEEVCEVEE